MRAFLGGAIDDETTTTGNVWSAFKVDSEINAAEDRAIQHTDNRETAIREDMNAADQLLQDNIDTETQERIAADNALQSNIDTEQQARIDADNLLQQNLDSETQARISADNTLQDNIDSETQARTTADNTLQSNIDAEAQARADADDQLQLQITNLEAYAENTYYKKEGGHISGDVSIAGNLTVQGETVQVDSQISTADRVIIINDGEVGTGVTGGFAGLEVDRGTADDYEFGFSEVSGYFEMGKKDARQPAMTREVSPADGKVLKWNATNKRAEASDLNWSEIAGKPDLVTEQQFSSLLTNLKDSFVSGKQSIDAVS